MGLHCPLPEEDVRLVEEPVVEEHTHQECHKHRVSNLHHVHEERAGFGPAVRVKPAAERREERRVVEPPVEDHCDDPADRFARSTVGALVGPEQHGERQDDLPFQDFKDFNEPVSKPNQKTLNQSSYGFPSLFHQPFSTFLRGQRDSENEWLFWKLS